MSVDYGTTASGAKRLFAGTSVPGSRTDIAYAPAHVRFLTIAEPADILLQRKSHSADQLRKSWIGA